MIIQLLPVFSVRCITTITLYFSKPPVRQRRPGEHERVVSEGEGVRRIQQDEYDAHQEANTALFPDSSHTLQRERWRKNDE